MSWDLQHFNFPCAVLLDAMYSVCLSDPPSMIQCTLTKRFEACFFQSIKSMELIRIFGKAFLLLQPTLGHVRRIAKLAGPNFGFFSTFLTDGQMSGAGPYQSKKGLPQPSRHQATSLVAVALQWSPYSSDIPHKQH
jgi:hypothetical protein